MPAYSSHYLFACDMMDALSKISLTELNKEAVFLGTQGPDIFFFHMKNILSPSKNKRSAGSQLHRAAPSALFGAMAQYLKQNSDDAAALSYAYGFICHYALDRTVHPFVYGFQKQIMEAHKRLKGFTVHNTIEFSIDNVMLNSKLGQQKPYKFKTAPTVTADSKVLCAVAKMLCRIVPDVTDSALTFEEAVTVLKNTKTVQRITTDVTGIKTTLIKTIESLLSPLLSGYRISAMMRPLSLKKSLAYVNGDHKSWCNPNKPDEERKESFFELYERSLKECPVLINAFNAELKGHGNLAAATGEISFLTGLSVGK